MKTTLNLPDDLMRDIKIRAARENRKLQDLIAELLRIGMSQPPEPPPGQRRRVQLPLVHCLKPAQPNQEMTPERVAQILLDQETHESVR